MISNHIMLYQHWSKYNSNSMTLRESVEGWMNFIFYMFEAKLFFHDLCLYLAEWSYIIKSYIYLQEEICLY